MKTFFNKYKLVILFSTFTLLLTFINDKIMINTEQMNVGNYVFCKIILYLLLLMLWDFILKVFNKDKDALSYLKYFLIYFIPISLLLLVLWPGTMLGQDIIGFMEQAAITEYSYTLNYLTTVFYIISYMIFPYTSAPVILQTICFGILASFLVKNFRDITGSKWAYLFYLIFFIPHTLFYTYYANRPLLNGVFYALLVMILLIDILKNTKLSNKKLLALVILCGITSTWRSETIYLVLAIPLIIMLTYKLRWNVKNIIKIFGLCFLGFLVVSFPQKYHEKITATDVPSSRNLTIVVAPLSYMVTKDDLDITQDEYEAINKVLDIESMRKWQSFEETPAIWRGKCIKSYDKESYEEFLKAYVNVVRKNLNHYLYSKWQTFLIASSINGDYFTSNDIYEKEGDLFYNKEDTKPLFGINARYKAYVALEGTSTRFDFYNTITHFIGSLFIPLVAIFLLFVYSIIKRQWILFLITGMLIGNFAITFLTAPAAYFMYYFNIYITGWILLILFIVIYINKKKVKN